VAIARDGWGAVTTRQVAALAGVNPALVHYHFGSMDALRREAALTALTEEVSGPTSALLQEDSLADGLVACLAAVGAIDPRAPRSVVLYEAILAAARDDDLRAMLSDALDLFRSLLVERIRCAGGATPEASAAAVAAALDGAVLHRLVSPDLDVSALADPLIAALALPSNP
jgi:AcrR family transcriptional regulator